MTTADITSVRSAHGHQFIGQGEDEEHDGAVTGHYVSCLTCGALYVLRPTPDAPNDGAYETNGGGEPAPCTHDTSMVHGYSGERACECDAGCPHCEHRCPCLACDS